MVWIWMLIFQAVLAEESFIVVLDPGHGGSQKGASIGDTYESYLVLDIAKRVERTLIQSNIQVLMTRHEDIEMSLSERSTFANDNNADVFISIHANAAPSKELFGIETYSVDIATDDFANQVAIRENKGEEAFSSDISIDPSTMLLSLELADLQQKHLIQSLSSVYEGGVVRDLGSKTALFSVLVRTEMPAILLEVGFLTNETELEHLLAAHYREHIAKGIASCVLEWIERNKE